MNLQVFNAQSPASRKKLGMSYSPHIIYRFSCVEKKLRLSEYSMLIGRSESVSFGQNKTENQMTFELVSRLNFSRNLTVGCSKCFSWKSVFPMKTRLKLSVYRSLDIKRTTWATLNIPLLLYRCNLSGNFVGHFVGHFLIWHFLRVSRRTIYHRKRLIELIWFSSLVIKYDRGILIKLLVYP